MTYVPTNIAEFASTRETSNEVALAIFEIAGEGREGLVWADPTDDERRQITDRAFELVDPDVDYLFWGDETLYRPGI